ncbi:MAG: iron-containing alcohol dehydrogenase [Clostridia bacterium]
MPFIGWRKPQLLELEQGVCGLPQFLKENGFGKALIVTGPTIRKIGLIDGLLSAMTDSGMDFAIFDKVQPNPTIDNIEDGVKLYNEQKCSCIIAFGGGSNMDCAKIIGARIARPKKQVCKMKGLLKVGKNIPPFFAIPTTAGSGSETTLAAVISNPLTHEKYPINDTHIIPHYALLDPQLTVALPPLTTATTGMDALTHAVEAYIGKSNTRETTEMAVSAIKLIFSNLRKAVEHGDDINARKNMQVASYKAGVAFTRAYVGYVHAIAHALGGFYQIPHGLANAVILPYVLERYGECIHYQLASLSFFVGLGTFTASEKANADIFIQAIRNMNDSFGIPNKIIGIKKEDIPQMAERAYKEATPLYPVPRMFDKKELEEIFAEIAE